MANGHNHISVCICTFKRPALLKRLLIELGRQKTQGLFSFSAVVADNDALQSARPVVAELRETSSFPVYYCVEPEQNIALARNKALENATGNFVAFIDDDEIPDSDWLCNHFKTCMRYAVDGVLGPVKPYYEHQPPAWILNGKFFERPTYETGYRLNWRETRTGNVLLKRSILNGTSQAFLPQFGTGSEDVDFFRRMMEQGNVFVWCHEAVVYELVPPARCSSRYLLKRSLLLGSNSFKHPTHRMRNLLKSAVAVPLYTLAMPLVALLGQHKRIELLTKLLYHASRIVAFLGWQPAREREI